jgi:hypothetical protein
MAISLFPRMRTPPVFAGLDPAIHLLRKSLAKSDGYAGQAPRMTQSMWDGTDYFSHSLSGTASRSGQAISPLVGSDNRAL